MLTMTLVSDGDPQDGQQAISISYNTGLTVRIVDKKGVEVGTVSAVGTNEPVAADEPHPVFEKEAEPAPEVTPEVIVTESSP